MAPAVTAYTAWCQASMATSFAPHWVGGGATFRRGSATSSDPHTARKWTAVAAGGSRTAPRSALGMPHAVP